MLVLNRAKVVNQPPLPLAHPEHLNSQTPLITLRVNLHHYKPFFFSLPATL